MGTLRISRAVAVLVVAAEVTFWNWFPSFYLLQNRPRLRSLFTGGWLELVAVVATVAFLAVVTDSRTGVLSLTAVAVDMLNFALLWWFQPGVGWQWSWLFLYWAVLAIGCLAAEVLVRAVRDARQERRTRLNPR